MTSETAVRQIQMEPSWLEAIGEQEFKAPYMQDLRRFLIEEKQQYQIYPPSKEMFNAFWKSPFSSVKVVILGQDPYHGVGQAHGLCFSVKQGVKIPPSLVNIFKELKLSMGIEIPTHGNLEKWAEQGVFLLNTVLSVRAHQANSHAGKGWEQFTDKVISVLNNEQENIVFLLWGSPARKKCAYVDRNKHLVLEAVHPSPLSAHRGFLGSNHFAQANEYLKQHGIEPIDWDLN